MQHLIKIRDVVQRTAEAIKDVLKVDVEVVDEDMVRIACTGQTQDLRGQVMVEGFIYRHVLDTGSTVVIDNPGCHELCAPCSRHGRCPEEAEIAAPIVYSGRTVGVIGLVSYDAEQTEQLMKNRDWLVMFLGKMAELITGALPASEAGGHKGEALNLVELEKEAIIKALEEAAGSSRRKEKAAEALGISRATIYRKMKEYNLE